MIGQLSDALTVGGKEYPIRSDYRNVLQVFEAFSDPELTKEEKWIVAIYLLLKPFSCTDDVFLAAEEGFDVTEAAQQISWFVSAGEPEKEVLEKPTYNWRQDEQMIFSAVNKVAGKEVRELEYLHWWTFLGYFSEVGEGTFTYIVGIRSKINNHKNLDKHEKEFIAKNKKLVKLEKPKTREELEQDAEMQAILDEVLG